MEPIVFITSNKNKFLEFSNFFNFPITQNKIDLPEIQTLIPEELINNKLLNGWEVIKKPLIVEDTFLSFNAWNG